MHKPGLKALGVSLMAVLGLMAFFAVGAQAENLSNGGSAGLFEIEHSGALVVGAKIAAEVLPGKLLIKSKNAYVECKKGSIVESNGISDVQILAVVRFEECAAYNHTTGVLLGACPVEGVSGAADPKGKIDATGLALPRLHGGKLFVLFENEPGKPFALIKFGPECGIGTCVSVSGSVVAEVDNGNHAVKHLLTFSEAIQLLFQVNGVGDKLSYGAAEAFIVGEAHVTLTGPHTGKEWAVV